jgi:urease accessory protein
MDRILSTAMNMIMSMVMGTDMSTESAARLRLLHLASPVLPVGAYSYSQGLESAAEAGDVHDAASAGRWIEAVLTHAVARLEAPVMVRAMRAWAAGDCETALSWNAYFVASRESAELRAETLQMGYSLRTLLVSLGVAGVDALTGVDELAWPTAWAFAAAAWQVPEAAAMDAWLWSWTENQVLAAVKIVPLGQTDGQRLLLALTEPLLAAARTALELDDDSLGAFVPRLALLSARHETQYSRLFRS